MFLDLGKDSDALKEHLRQFGRKGCKCVMQLFDIMGHSGAVGEGRGEKRGEGEGEEEGEGERKKKSPPPLPLVIISAVQHLFTSPIFTTLTTGKGYFPSARPIVKEIGTILDEISGENEVIPMQIEGDGEEEQAEKEVGTTSTPSMDTSGCRALLLQLYTRCLSFLAECVEGWRSGGGDGRATTSLLLSVLEMYAHDIMAEYGEKKKEMWKYAMSILFSIVFMPTSGRGDKIAPNFWRSHKTLALSEWKFSDICARSLLLLAFAMGEEGNMSSLDKVKQVLKHANVQVGFESLLLPFFSAFGQEFKGREAAGKSN